MKSYNLLNHATLEEQKILKKWFLTRQDKTNLSWMVEAIEILGWTIGLWPEISEVHFANEDRQADAVPQKKDPTKFIQNAKRIDNNKIYQMADLTYRLHWTSKRENIGELGVNSSSVYKERHKAINWVLGVDSWDEISADT